MFEPILLKDKKKFSSHHEAIKYPEEDIFLSPIIYLSLYTIFLKFKTAGNFNKQYALNFIKNVKKGKRRIYAEI